MLERYVLGELPRKRMRRIGELIESDPACKLRVEEIRHADEVFHKHYSNQEIMAGINARAHLLSVHSQSSKINQRRFFVPGMLQLGVVFTALVFAVGIPVATKMLSNSSRFTYGSREKGIQPHLTIYKKNQQKVDRLSNGFTVCQGDTIQLAYVAAGKKFGVIVSLDGRGVITRHLVSSSDSSVSLIGPSEQILNHSYEFDDAERFEQFFFITSDSMFSEADIHTAVKQSISHNAPEYADSLLRLGKKYSVFSIILRKAK